MIQALSGEAAADPEGAWIEVQEASAGVFIVTDDNMTDDDNTCLGFVAWDGEVEDLDCGSSDESQCFGMSDHLRWNDVDLRLMHVKEFRAPSISRLVEALSHVTLTAWDPYDI